MNLNHIDEKWLSDRLELVLTTTGIDQGLGIQFAKRFVSKVYDNIDHNYTLQNSLVMREYPISVNRVNRSNKTKFIDLLYLDLDKNDNVVIGIENKFLTQDSKNQISDYKKTLEELYQNKDCKVKIVYLTLDGRVPIYYKEDNIICLSWTEDILIMLLETLFDCTIDSITIEILNKWKNKQKKNLNKDIVNLINTLIEIRQIQHNKDNINNKTNEQLIKNFVIQLLEHKSLKELDKQITVSYIGKCYKITHKYRKITIFVPITKNIEQFTHMIKRFCIMLLNDDHKKSILADSNKLDLEQSNIAVNGIVDYFNKKDDRDE